MYGILTNIMGLLIYHGIIITHRIRMYGIQMRTKLGYIDGKCCHKNCTHGSYGYIYIHNITSPNRWKSRFLNHHWICRDPIFSICDWGWLYIYIYIYMHNYIIICKYTSSFCIVIVDTVIFVNYQIVIPTKLGDGSSLGDLYVNHRPWGLNGSSFKRRACFVARVYGGLLSHRGTPQSSIWMGFFLT